jgi:hypothetical protein
MQVFFFSVPRFSSLLFFALCLLLWLPLSSCGTPEDPKKNDPDTIDQRVEIPTPLPAEEGFQIVMPETIIPKGTEKMVCWIPEWVPDKDYLVTQFEGFQGSMGHHVVALRSGVPRKAGEVFDCTNLAQMTSLQPLILPDVSNQKLLKPGYAVRLPKDSKIVIQSHYVNTTTKDLKVADVARFRFAPKDQPQKVVGYLIMNHGAIDIAQGEQTADLSCEIKKPKRILLMLGHMHDYGKAFRVEMVRSGERKTLYNIDKWNVDMRDRPPVTFFDGEDTLEFQPGDKLSTLCTYNNTTGEPLRFPAEMCTTVMYYYSEESSELIQCNE